MKKLIALLLALVMVLALAACAAKTEPAKSPRIRTSFSALPGTSHGRTAKTYRAGGPPPSTAAPPSSTGR